ncbi:MAG: CdaR family transcriptional regulator [Tissierellaceae bacterium]|jgi:carbohydrate diacid regulator|nr:transcriptional regulator [Tissierellia bacterium]
MKLSKEQAQSIVEQVMEVIPYNINIMNEEGIIIGSGDSKRLNKLHIGALEAIEKREAIEVYHGTKDVKPGINTPIFFQDNPIGVIGITGEPDIVRPFGEMVRVMAELLVKQDYILNQQNIRKQQIEEYLYELSYKTSPYTEKFIERGKYLGIDVLVPRLAVVIFTHEDNKIRTEKRLKLLLGESEYYVNMDHETLGLFLNVEDNPIYRIEDFVKDNKKMELQVGIGRPHEILANSLSEAIKALEIGRKLQGERRIHKYDDLYFISTLSIFSKDERFKKLKQELEEADLLETLIIYIRMNGEINRTAEALFIHRNTLNYRLERIKELTGKDPKNYMDLLELFIAYMISEL